MRFLASAKPDFPTLHPPHTPHSSMGLISLFQPWILGTSKWRLMVSPEARASLSWGPAGPKRGGAGGLDPESEGGGGIS